MIRTCTNKLNRKNKKCSIVGFDRFGVLEESDETIKGNKKKLIKLFL